MKKKIVSVLTTMVIAGCPIANSVFADEVDDSNKVEVKVEEKNLEARTDFTKTPTLKKGQSVTYQFVTGSGLSWHKNVKLRFLDIETGSSIKYEIRRIDDIGAVLPTVVASGTVTGTSTRNHGGLAKSRYQIKLTMVNTTQTNGDKFTMHLDTY